MTVLPGSLDYLYYNGIIDHIPYEAYDMQPVMNGSQYLNMAQQGALYNTYNSQDSFVRRKDSHQNEYSVLRQAYGIGNGIGRDVDYEVMANGEEGKNLRLSILDAAGKTKGKVSNSSNLTKGVLSAGVILLTLACLFKGKKRPLISAHGKTSGSMWNPINWFKK